MARLAEPPNLKRLAVVVVVSMQVIYPAALLALVWPHNLTVHDGGTTVYNKQVVDVADLTKLFAGKKLVDAGEVDVAAPESVLAEIAAPSKEPAKLPEVEEFLENKCTTIDNLDDSTWVIEVDHVGEFLDQLTAAHAAELIEAEAKGRREALAYDPPIPDEIKDTSWKAEWFWAGVRAMKQQTEEAK